MFFVISALLRLIWRMQKINFVAITISLAVCARVRGTITRLVLHHKWLFQALPFIIFFYTNRKVQQSDHRQEEAQEVMITFVCKFATVLLIKGSIGGQMRCRHAKETTINYCSSHRPIALRPISIPDSIVLEMIVL